MHSLCLIMLARNTIFIDLLHITLPKLHVKFQPHPLRDFLRKGKKSKGALMMYNYAN